MCPNCNHRLTPLAGQADEQEIWECDRCVWPLNRWKIVEGRFAQSNETPY